MKRFLFIGVLVLGVVAAGLPVMASSVTGTMPCCQSEMGCEQAFTQQSCCEEPVRSTSTILSSTPKPVKVSLIQVRYAEEQLLLACGNRSPSQGDDPTVDEESLYLLNASFLI